MARKTKFYVRTNRDGKPYGFVPTNNPHRKPRGNFDLADTNLAADPTPDDNTNNFQVRVRHRNYAYGAIPTSTTQRRSRGNFKKAVVNPNYVTEPTIFSWNVTVVSPTDNYIANIQLKGATDVDIDWGDGIISNATDSALIQVKHTYAVVGTYIIKLSGTFIDVPDDGFAGNVSFKYIGANLTATSPIDATINNLTDAFDTTNIASLPAGFLDKATRLKYIDKMFFLCQFLTALPAGLFAHCPLESAVNTFRACIRLISIPSGLFLGQSKITTFESCFQGCILITAIPSGFFTGCSAVITFKACFSSCSILQTVPTGLFADCHEVTDFSSLFASTRVASIPTDLFTSNTKVTTFLSCFNNSLVTAIPPTLFATNTAVIYFSACFASVSITTIPANLFVNNLVVIDFAQCFANCTFLTGPAPTLWLSYPDATGNGCFANDTGLSNFAAIPSAPGSPPPPKTAWK